MPEELIAEEMQVMYRSKLCTFTDHTASGVPYQRDGYKRTDIKPMRRGQTDLYETILALDGGGACQWRLSNVTFGVIYKDPASFGDGIYYGAGGGVVVMFDGNNPGRAGMYKKVEGDLVLRRDYYPWVNERFIGGHKQSVNLTGEGPIYEKYQALQASRIYFEPILHSRFMTRSIEPKEKREGNQTIFYYPDGSSSTEIQDKPDFRKLQVIRLAAEAQE
ncbi:hypothetical protein ACIPZG_24320 [Pseudomonas sp. NPDC089395]|uniref:hypothetical protein n=1 Tax=Pseudomonas sp. NPDC089395 TaxID=3364460 RepID=UPI0038060C5C